MTKNVAECVEHEALVSWKRDGLNSVYYLHIREQRSMDKRGSTNLFKRTRSKFKPKGNMSNSLWEVVSNIPLNALVTTLK